MANGAQMDDQGNEIIRLAQPPPRAPTFGECIEKALESARTFMAGLEMLSMLPAVASGTYKGPDIDLAAWARGEITRLFHEVQLAIAGQLGKLVGTRREAIQLLIERGVIDAAAARRDFDD
jgi:hypothetical protein